MTKRWGRKGALPLAVLGVVAAFGVFGCSSDGNAEGAARESGRPSGESLDPATPEPEPGSSDAVYRFVDTPDGMTIEAVSGEEVQTQSCRTRTCAGLCDECAVRACQAIGQLTAACERLLENCTSTCTCDSSAGPNSRCGFPVCTANRNLCYIDDEASQPSSSGGPEPDPSPIRPNESY